MSFATYDLLKNAVLQANIRGFEAGLTGYDDKTQYDLLLRMSQDNIPPLLIYTIQSHLLIKKKKSYYAHEPIAQLTHHYLREYDGYSVAVYHLRKIRGYETRITKWHLSYNDQLGSCVRKEEAIQLARSIYSSNSSDEQAQKKLAQLNVGSNYYKNIEKMKLALAKGDLGELHRLVSGYYSKDAFGIFFELARSVSEIAVFTYFASRLIKKPNVIRLYREASMYLNFELLYLNAYSIAVHYDRRILALEPDNIDNKISLACYATMPDKLVKKKEAIKLAKDIIKKDPKNYTAIQILYGHKYAYNLLVNKQLEDISC